ncbi:MAG TPA: hypothetical protein PKO28_02375 [Bacilli bacterium]|nr:hypothetical protein [Bacilli bacterium]HPS19112.1 hypothetical protein [Bacilli bacterium]
MANKDEWVLLAIIAKRSQKQKILQSIVDFGVAMINQVLAKGSAKEGLLRTLGLTREEQYVFLSGFVPHEKVGEIFDLLKSQYNFNKPNSGIAFTIPLDKISY